MTINVVRFTASQARVDTFDKESGELVRIRAIDVDSLIRPVFIYTRREAELEPRRVSSVQPASPRRNASEDELSGLSLSPIARNPDEAANASVHSLDPSQDRLDRVELAAGLMLANGEYLGPYLSGQEPVVLIPFGAGSRRAVLTEARIEYIVDSSNSSLRQILEEQRVSGERSELNSSQERSPAAPSRVLQLLSPQEVAARRDPLASLANSLNLDDSE